MDKVSMVSDWWMWLMGIAVTLSVVIHGAIWSYVLSSNRELFSRVNSLSAEFSSFRVEVAKEYVSARALEKTEAALLSAIREVTDRITTLSDKFHEYQLEDAK